VWQVFFEAFAAATPSSCA